MCCAWTRSPRHPFEFRDDGAKAIIRHLPRDRCALRSNDPLAYKGVPVEIVG